MDPLDIAETSAAALKLIDDLYLRLGAHLPSELWRAKISLESAVIYYSAQDFTERAAR